MASAWSNERLQASHQRYVLANDYRTHNPVPIRLPIHDPLGSVSEVNRGDCAAPERITRYVVALHASIYTMALLLTGGLTLWALFFMATGRPPDGAFRATYVLTIGVGVVQAIVGVFMVLDDLRPVDNYHYLYGVSLIVFMGGGYALATRGGDARREALIFGLSSAFAFGLILRAAVTAG